MSDISLEDDEFAELSGSSNPPNVTNSQLDLVINNLLPENEGPEEPVAVAMLGFQALNQNLTEAPKLAQPNSAKCNKRPTFDHGAATLGPSKEKKLKKSKKVMSKEILDGSGKKEIIGTKKLGSKGIVEPDSGEDTTGIRKGAGTPGKASTVPSKKRIIGSKKVKSKEILEPDAGGDTSSTGIDKQICGPSPGALPVRDSKEKKFIKSKKVKPRKKSDGDFGDDDSGTRKENISPPAVSPGSERKKSRESKKVKSKEILGPDSGDTSNPTYIPSLSDNVSNHSGDVSNLSDDVSNHSDDVTKLTGEEFSDNCGEELALDKKEQEVLIRAKEKMKVAAYERRKQQQKIRSQMNRELKAKREADILKENESLKKQVQNFAKAIEEYYSSHELSGLKTEKVKYAVTKWIKNKM